MPGFEYAGDITMSCSVADLDASLAWYAEKLGFEEIYKLPEEGWAEMTTSTPGVTLGLGQNEAVDGKGGVTPVFGVTDIEAARQELEDKGVKFDGETGEVPDMVKFATFYDLDGNSFMLSQSLVQE